MSMHERTVVVVDDGGSETTRVGDGGGSRDG